jgi:molybdopterin/thiamine biosynthesis adenylyltransferase
MGHGKLVLTEQTAAYPSYLQKALSASPADITHEMVPVLIRMQEADASGRLEHIVKANPGLELIDNYAEQYAELLLSKHAHLYRANYDVQVASIADLLTDHYDGQEPWQMGSWVYFPWKRQLVHLLAQADFEALRTIRNRDLITSDEQATLFDFNVASFGMSVGSAGALALGISGISRQLKLIDGAVISGSNLNRILTGVSSVGKSKATVIGQQIYEMNPYSEIAYFDKVSADTIANIFDDHWAVNAAIDEIDDIEMKVRIRYEARKRRIPVVMASELGDTVVLDIERFDLEPKRELFHGRLPGVEALIDQPLENYREWTRHAVKIIDPTNMPLKMQQSLLKIGSTIVTHPQLGSTVMTTGGILAFAIKHIATGSDLKSGRYTIALEKEMLADHQTRQHRKAHKKHTQLLQKSVNSM